jgi:hypothetical protein
VLSPSSTGRRPGAGGTRWPAYVFFSAWAVVGLAIALVLGFAPSHPSNGFLDGIPSYVGSSIPNGTRFAFTFDQAVAVYEINASTLSQNPPTYIGVGGNWSATAPTWVRLSFGGTGSSTCAYFLGCAGGPGNLSGPLQLSIGPPAPPGIGPAPNDEVLYLEFWAQGADSVTVTAPILANGVWISTGPAPG